MTGQIVSQAQANLKMSLWQVEEAKSGVALPPALLPCRLNEKQ